MSMPLIYAFYSVTQGGKPVDPNIADRKAPDYEELKISSFYSDYFTWFGPQTPEKIYEECIVALLKFIRLIEEGKISAQKAGTVNAVSVDESLASFNELAEGIAKGQIKLEVDEAQTIARVFPTLILRQ